MEPPSSRFSPSSLPHSFFIMGKPNKIQNPRRVPRKSYLRFRINMRNYMYKTVGDSPTRGKPNSSLFLPFWGKYANVPTFKFSFSTDSFFTTGDLFFFFFFETTSFSCPRFLSRPAGRTYVVPSTNKSEFFCCPPPSPPSPLHFL